MKVQHPIQHTLASFSTWLPVEETLRTGRYGKDDYVCGEFRHRREVFVDYFRALSLYSRTIAPHILFARSNGSIEEILAFTQEWGPLAPNDKEDSLLKVAFDRNLEATPHNCFAFYVGNWCAAREQFAKALQLAGDDNAKEIWSLLPYHQPKMGPVKRGAIYPYIDKGTKIEVLERLWTADQRMTREEVRRTAQNLGIFATEKRGPKYQIVYEAVSLIDAFWHMLFRDLSNKRNTVRICANPKCRKPYTAHRTDQKYCASECATKAANLTYYHRRGAGLRKARKKSSRPDAGFRT